MGTNGRRIFSCSSRDIFDISDSFIKVTFRFTEGTSITTPKTTPKTSLKNTPINIPKTPPEKINATQSSILELIETNSRITQREIAKELNLTIRVVKLSMKILENMGLLTRQGTARNGTWLRL